MPRSVVDGYGDFVGHFGAKGLAYIKVNDRDAGRTGLQSPIVKFLSDQTLVAIMQRVGAENGDLVFFGAGSTRVVNESMGALRIRVGKDVGLLEDEWRPVWIIDFPLFDWDENEKRWNALHHPFTAPHPDSLEMLDSDPKSCKSLAHDLVINGTEIGGGSVRIHRRDTQMKVFHLLGIGDEEAQNKFGFLLDALRFGCPPHGGIAFGLDRLAMLMTGARSIRDVIAFPKTQTASCLLTSAPSPAEESQLLELGIRLRPKP